MLSPEGFSDAFCRQRLPLACLSIMKGEANRLGLCLDQVQWYRPPSIRFLLQGLLRARLGICPDRPVYGGCSGSTFLGFAVLPAAPVQLLSFLFSSGPGSHRCVPLVRFDYNTIHLICQSQINKLFLKTSLYPLKNLPHAENTAAGASTWEIPMEFCKIRVLKSFATIWFKALTIASGRFIITTVI